MAHWNLYHRQKDRPNAAIRADQNSAGRVHLQVNGFDLTQSKSIARKQQLTVWTATALRRCVTAIFERAGASQANAQIVADHLVNADLAGHASHGVMRVAQYWDAIQAGELHPDAEPRPIQEQGAVATLDGENVFGQVAGYRATELAVSKARTNGIAGVTVRRCGHSGRLGAYAKQAADEGMVSIVTVNAGGGGQSVAPFGGAAPRLATNPIAIGAPTDGEFPILLDFATSMAPEGKIRDYARRGEPLPDGWIVDASGAPSNNPQDFYDTSGGAILPLGGTAGYKGFALAFMVDVLAGALSGAGCCSGEEVPPQDGILVIVLNPEHFSGADYARQQIAQLYEHVKSCPTSQQVDEVFAPGELEHRQTQHRLVNGIPLDDKTCEELRTIAAQLGVEDRFDASTNGAANKTREDRSASNSGVSQSRSAV